MEREIRVGDWVRFYQRRRLVLGVVAFVIQREGHQAIIQTDAGAIKEDRVLEVRRQAVEL